MMCFTLNSQRGLSAQNSMPNASAEAGMTDIQKQILHLNQSQGVNQLLLIHMIYTNPPE
jgi:hypothetical protein